MGMGSRMEVAWVIGGSFLGDGLARAFGQPGYFMSLAGWENNRMALLLPDTLHSRPDS